MATSLDVILVALQNGVNALNKGITALSSMTNAIISLNTTLHTAFPVVSATSTSATVGAITFSSSQPAIFLTVTTSSGGLYKFPGFNP